MSHYIRLPKIFVLIFMSLLVLFSNRSAMAQSIIRDTEIENTFRGWMAPLLKSANLGADSVNLILVNSPQVNAFVAGGANIFIYTGLIDKSESPGEIVGVMAHELGHIAGGHLIGGRAALERASYESILGAILGIGTAIVTGNGEAASAIAMGTSSMAQRRFLAHSRVNESSADQAALRFMDDAKINPEGLKTFLQKLEMQELVPADQQSEYARTHPITANRVSALEDGIKKAHAENRTVPKAWQEQHARMKAKLLGYIDPGRVVWVYNDTDQSIAANYARAIAAYRQNEFDKALVKLDDLLAKEPENPYFHELKAEILLNSGQVEQSLADYRQAVQYAPHASLIRIDLGKALLQSGKEDDQKIIKQAIEVLERAVIDEPRSTRAYRLLATAYGRLGQENMAKLNLAEEAVLQGRLPYAHALLEACVQSFEKDSAPWIKAQDLLLHIKNLQSKQEK